MKEIRVIQDLGNNRLDKFLVSELEGFSRSKVQTLISNGCVAVNRNCIIDSNYKLKCDDVVLIVDDFKEERPDLMPDKSVEFTTVYEDDDLLIVDKPAGVTVHAGAGNFSRTLVNGLIHHCGESLSSGGDKYRPGIVHRIDKDTSGILVIAKNDFSHAKLVEQFVTHTIIRKYICFCYSVLQPPHGKIENFLGRDKNNRLKMAVNDYGRRAITLYKTLKTYSKFASKVECELKTGRTHQIRVHMTHHKCSLIGDALYKAKNYHIPEKIMWQIRNFPRQALHAHFLEFLHPRSEKPIRFENDLSNDMKNLEKILEENSE